MAGPTDEPTDEPPTQEAAHSTRAVHHTYDRIAEHFSKTREYAWPEVEEFLADRKADVAVDVGCGNGRHAELLAERSEKVVGIDASHGLLAEARARATENGFEADLAVGDAARLPLQTATADLAIYVATLHHLRTRDERIASLDELARVLHPDGVGLVSTWSTEHDRFDATAGFDTTVDWTLPGGETVPRFYHIYTPEEFRADLDASALAVADAFVSSGNCYGVVHPEGKLP